MICWFHVNGSRVQYNDKFCHLVNSYEGSGIVIDYLNFRRGLAVFISRNRDILPSNWIIDSDLYLEPLQEDREDV
jgi:hypothetical protein